MNGLFEKGLKPESGDNSMTNNFKLRFCLVALILALSLILSSCRGNQGINGTPDIRGEGKVTEKNDDKKESPVVESINDFFPHQTGDNWTYWLMVKNPEGTAGGEVSMKFTGKEKIDDTECIVSEIVAEGQTVGKNFFKISDDKVVVLRHSMPEGDVINFDPPAVIFKYPIKKGDTWVNSDKTEKFETTYKVEGEEELELPIGKVKAWKITNETIYSQDEKVGNEAWYVKGIGKVQERNYSKRGSESQESLITMKSYDVGEVNSNELIEKSIKSKQNAHEQMLEYFPLKIGSQWVYKDETTGPQGKEAEQENLYEITGVEDYQGKECIILNRLMHKMPMFKSKDLYVIDGDKLFTFGSKDIKEGKKEPALMLKFPFKAGEKWETNEDSVRRIHKVVGEEDVEVPAGKFKAWKMENTYIIDKGIKQTSEVAVWYAKGVGVVKVDSVAKAKDMTVKNRMELMEYRIPGEKK